MFSTHIVILTNLVTDAWAIQFCCNTDEHTAGAVSNRIFLEPDPFGCDAVNSKQYSFYHLSCHHSLFHSLYMSQPSYSLSLYKFYNILPVYESIQFFIISNSPDIHLL